MGANFDRVGGDPAAVARLKDEHGGAITSVRIKTERSLGRSSIQQEFTFARCGPLRDRTFGDPSAQSDRSVGNSADRSRFNFRQRHEPNGERIGYRCAIPVVGGSQVKHHRSCSDILRPWPVHGVALDRIPVEAAITGGGPNPCSCSAAYRSGKCDARCIETSGKIGSGLGHRALGAIWNAPIHQLRRRSERGKNEKKSKCNRLDHRSGSVLVRKNEAEGYFRSATA